MKNNKVVGVIVVATIGFILAGCTDAIDQAIDEYNNDNSDSVTRTAGIVKYSDGTAMGTTRPEPQVNGGYPIYNIGTGGVVGFIRLDGQVNDIAGRSLGVCTGNVISESGLLGDCTIPYANPNTSSSSTQSTPISSQPSACSQTYSSTPSGCEDRRDGTFDVTWDRPTCESHGYFYCTLNNICTDQTVNINQCLGR